MTFLDAFNGWSALHLLGSFILTTTLGTTSLGPLQVGLISFGVGAGWEVMADQTLRVNDERGGDYYDILWDLAGCAAGVAALGLSGKWHADYAAPPLGIRAQGIPKFPLDDDHSGKIMPSWRIGDPFSRWNCYPDFAEFEMAPRLIFPDPNPVLAKSRYATRRIPNLEIALQKK
jgi:hypothetical protein